MPNVFDKYGHVTYGTTRALVSDLTPSFYAGTRNTFDLLQFGQELWSSDTTFSWTWIVSHGDILTSQTFSENKPYLLHIPDAPEVTVKIELVANGITSDIVIENTYPITSNPNIIDLWNNRSPITRAALELVTDFKQYVIDAADATGSHGISPRFLASVLYIEISNRSKIIPEDASYRSRLTHPSRHEEIMRSQEQLFELTLERHGTGLFDGFNVDILGLVDTTIGVGQARMSTLAMALGYMPLIEHERVSGHASNEDAILEQLYELPTDKMWELFRMLRWSKSAIMASAKILTSLKNRPNRYRAMTESGV